MVLTLHQSSAQTSCPAVLSWHWATVGSYGGGGGLMREVPLQTMAAIPQVASSQYAPTVQGYLAHKKQPTSLGPP